MLILDGYDRKGLDRMTGYLKQDQVEDAGVPVNKPLLIRSFSLQIRHETWIKGTKLYGILHSEDLHEFLMFLGISYMWPLTLNLFSFVIWPFTQP